MDESLQAIVDFVEGRMSGKDFEQRVYTDSALETLLKDETMSWRGTYIETNPYDFIIALNYADPGNVLNAQGAMELYLTKRGVSFERTETYSDFYNLLLQAQPKWLDIDTLFLEEHVLPEAGDRVGRDLKKWLHGRLKELFRYQKQPPNWIQNPEWPINENGPMYFLGEIRIDDPELFHDRAAAFLFLDRKTGVTETVIQVF
jgi:hypothetical protein